MKNSINVFKWILHQSKAYTLHIFAILSLGGILSIVSVYRAMISKNLIDSATSGNNSILFKSLILLALLIITELLSSSLNTILSAKCQAKLGTSIQKRIYNHIIKGRWQEQIKYHSGNLSARLTSDVDAITNVITNSLPNIFSLSVRLIISFIILLRLEPELGIIVIIISPLSILLSRLYARKLKEIYKNAQEADAKCRSFMQESFQNLLILKTFCLETKNISDLTDLQNKKINLIMKKNYISIFSNFVLNLGSWSILFLVFFWGSRNLSKGILTFGTLTALLQLVGNIQGPFYGLATTLPQLVAAIGSSERIIELLNIPVEQISDSNLHNLIFKGISTDIVFNNVDFSYKKNTKLLKSITFRINSGEIIGLVGSSGEGKTTILRLLLGLVNPYKGETLIVNNGKEVNITSTTRNLISYVPQGNTLFSGTIKENLLYGNTDATMTDIKEAVDSSYAWDFINGLDNKFDTFIGEKGLGLSEGQAQRVSIARALLRKKPILILDEATSSLDMDTEIKILKSVQNLSYKPTCIIITHRPSALKICDRILKLENGQLSEIVKDTEMKLEAAVEIIQK